MAFDQRKLEKEFVFAGKGTAAELLTELDQIAALEKKGALKPRRVRQAALAVFMILSVVWVKLDNPLMLVLAIVVPIGLFIYSLFLGWGPVLHPRVELLKLALNALNQDAGKKTRFDVMLRLQEKTESVKGPGTGIYTRDSWLTLSGRLGDGTVISEAYIDLLRERSKRGRSGKTKYKKRRQTMVRVQLDYDRERYGDASVAAARVQAPFRPSTAAGPVLYKAVQTTDRMIAVKALVQESPAPTNLHAVTEGVLLGAYRILNLARRGVVATGRAS
ncbi:MAG TPA: hypothetical protein VGL53_29720 [Bryobacteraceae bacterium]|jgi:hypothetical protein